MSDSDVEHGVADLLQMSSLRTLSVTKKDGYQVIEAEGATPVEVCPDCHGVRLYRHGVQTQAYRDTPMYGAPAVLSVHRQRYRCQDCGTTFSEPLTDLDSKRMATRRLVQYVEAHVFDQTCASLARQVGMDEKTIRQIFADHVADLESRVRFVTPRWLGIDELKIVGAYRCVLTNIERKTLFDLRESRNKADLLAYFTNLRDKERIEWVTMDMYHVYRQVVHATLPRAHIIVDKFHIQRMANEAMEVVRKDIRRGLSQRQRLKLKDERFLLLKRQRDLSEGARERMRAWFDRYPQLGLAHELKERFLGVWDHDTRASAEAAYVAWEATVPDTLQSEFREVITAMHNWRDEIFNYFDHRLTNAYTESANNLTRAMNRMGRGYSFDVIRARMLYNGKARKAGTVAEQKPAEEHEGVAGALGYEIPGADSSAPTLSRLLCVPAPPTRRTVEYGPSIDVLTQMLEDGEFE